ncbi:AAA family ATPase [Agrobacterium vaccinii]|uniref:AAA family ATPase n=1 Tax=Agrobacterium vaccinii TaxID=2735528 RepID=UPI001E5A5F6E|nr:AAA family ATPase [Agrobacterium vaccinii]UHS59732.1 AAA family ATPase [Agrobacterium vaccinii]
MRLKSITIENFRSISGSITVGLDAPVIIVHGPNGAGKTSFLSAIEIGLLGRSAALARVDPDYAKNLPHQSSNSVVTSGRISLQVEDAGALRTSDISVTSSGIEGTHILSGDQSHFYSERCYLAQSAMGRLLDLYQAQERKADSALTKFVKDLLGLDQFEALIDGLYPAANVTRLRDPAPAYWGAREDVTKLGDELERLDLSIHDQSETLLIVSNQLQLNAKAISANLIFDGDNPDILRSYLYASDQQAELQSVASARRNLIAMRDQWSRALTSKGGSDITQLEEVFASLSKAFDDWGQRIGVHLTSVVTELKTDFPELTLLDSGSPETVRSKAALRLSAELDRVTTLLSTDFEQTSKFDALEERIRKGEARILTLDEQIASFAGDTESLANILAALQHHIHGDLCPVCNRDFAESGQRSLAAHVSSNIASLVEASGRLQSMVVDKATTSSAIADATRERDMVKSRRLNSADLNELKTRQPRLLENSLRLEQLEPDCKAGEPVYEQFFAVRAQIQSLRSTSETIASLRNDLQKFITTLGVPSLSDHEPLAEAFERLFGALDERQTDLERRQASRERAKDSLNRWVSASSQLTLTRKQANDIRLQLMGLRRRKVEADRRIDVAKSLSSRAVAARASLVRRVFNDDLNAVWRDLFVRLAPDEPFIPAFAIPKSTGPVEAILKTVHRDGGDGGNPRAMLSAGNLNTAALTLFLSLHLSVHPTLPWLIIDDPVQSMDEVHIAQFAALLRTLSKQLKRQIVIAVHEKDLFDYLALELSPAFLDDRLITVDIGRSAVEETTAPWIPHVYVTDRAVA